MIDINKLKQRLKPKGRKKASGAITPARLADAVASKETLYFSIDREKLVYKDKQGNIKELYE